MDPLKELIVYLRVAQAFKNRLQMSDRDRALILAATCASMLEMKSIANFCRKMVLQNNRGHMLRKYDTFHQALEDPDFGVFLKQVRRKLSAEDAASQLSSLEYFCDVRQSDYETKTEFAAAVMGVDPEWLEDHFSE
ncbi:MAG: hypothetical protein AB8B55_07450 [Mariniblastus sp.]